MVRKAFIFINTGAFNCAFEIKAYYQMGMSYLALKQQDKAINAFEKSIEINPKNPN
jgi:tetratricopeptide (TPR) repeat protein